MQLNLSFPPSFPAGKHCDVNRNRAKSWSAWQRSQRVRALRINVRNSYMNPRQRKRRRCWYVTVPSWKNTGETDGKKTPRHFWSEVFEVINTIWQRPKNILRCPWQGGQFTKRMTKRPRLLTRRGLLATKNYLDSDSVVSSVSGAFSSSAAAVGWLSAFLVTRAIAFLEKSR